MTFSSFIPGNLIFKKNYLSLTLSESTVYFISTMYYNISTQLKDLTIYIYPHNPKIQTEREKDEEWRKKFFLNKRTIFVIIQLKHNSKQEFVLINVTLNYVILFERLNALLLVFIVLLQDQNHQGPQKPFKRIMFTGLISFQ